MNKKPSLFRKIMLSIFGTCAGVMCLIGFSCKNSITIPHKDKKTGVLVIGGLGATQTNEISKYIADNCDVDVDVFGGGDEYKTDIIKCLSDHKYEKVVLIGHSFGCDDIVNTMYTVNIDLVVLIDPVSTSWGDLTLPKQFKETLVFYRSDEFGPKTADVIGDTTTWTINGGHNDIPHNKTLIQIIKDRIDLVTQ